MEKVNEVFFSEKGLTSTSASHLADLAQKTVLGNEAKLKNMSFITTKVDIVGSLSESGKTVSLGYDEKGLSEVKGLLEEIAEMNAFCAWMREAIKAKEREIQQINRCSFDEWCQLFGYPVIEKTELPKEIRAEDLIAEMNVKERNRYFTLEAIAATIGKYIHPGGKFSDAREELLTKTMKPYTADGITSSTKNPMKAKRLHSQTSRCCRSTNFYEVAVWCMTIPTNTSSYITVQCVMLMFSL